MLHSKLSKVVKCSGNLDCPSTPRQKKAVHFYISQKCAQAGMAMPALIH